MQATERVRDGMRAVQATGTAEEVRRFLTTAKRLGTLVDADQPVPAGQGLWQVRAVLWAVAEPVRVPQAALPGPPVWVTPPWLTGRVVARTVAGLAVAAALAGLLWVLWQAATGAAQWTAGHAGQVVAVLVLAGLAGAAWAVRRLRRGAPACTTTTVHGRRCRGH